MRNRIHVPSLVIFFPVIPFSCSPSHYDPRSRQMKRKGVQFRRKISSKDVLCRSEQLSTGIPGLRIYSEYRWVCELKFSSRNHLTAIFFNVVMYVLHQTLVGHRWRHLRHRTRHRLQVKNLSYFSLLPIINSIIIYIACLQELVWEASHAFEGASSSQDYFKEW